MMRNVLIFFGFLLLFSSCKREKAIWDSDWEAPLLYDSLTLGNLVTDSIISVSNGFYSVDFNKTVFELKLSEFVNLPDTTVDHTFAFNISSLNVPAGASFVNSLVEHDIDLGDIELKQARIKRGGIDVSVKNPIGTTTYFTIQLPGVTKNGVMLSKNFTAPPGTNLNPGITTGFVDLEGYTMDLRGQNQGSFNIIQTKMLVSTDPTGPDVVVHNYDSVRFNFTMKNVDLDYARGYFGQEILSDTIVTNIDALNSLADGTIDLDPATLGITIENGMKISGVLKLHSIKNTNAQGNVVVLTHPIIGSDIILNSATGSSSSTLQPSSTNIVFDQGNSNLETFLENHGVMNTVAYQIQLNPWGNVSGGYDEIYDEHPLKVNVDASLPLNISLSNLVVQDTFDLNLAQNVNSTHVKEGKLFLDVNNAFPMQGEIKLFFLTSNGTVISTVVGSSSIASSLTGTIVNGVQQKSSQVIIDLPSSVLEKLTDVKKCAVQFKMSTPDANGTIIKVAIPSNAFLKFKIRSKFIVENHV